ncbi:MAG: hypothetical protein QNJ40_17730 [Xanthomonadales bacterium]|nr:hypothetical protein [Xanthomonadales bacterium]
MQTVSEADVRAQLDRLLSSEQFAGSERICRFLSHIVEQTLAGNERCLKGYNLGLEVFDRGSDFDPQIDSIVRVEAGRLRRLLDQYYYESGRRDPVRIVVPKGGYAAEFSPGEADTPLSKSNLPPAPVPSGPAIIVLPFKSMSLVEEDKLLADGLTDEIIANLARFTTLFVLAQNTSFQYKNRPVDVRALGRELEVNYVLEGSVRHAGNALRITTQLLDTTSGAHVWSESYDRTFVPDDVLKLQDEIAAKVVASTAEPHGLISRHELAQHANRSIPSLATYQALLRYYGYLRVLEPSTHKAVRDEFEVITREHPDYSMGWFALSALTIDEIMFRFNPKTQDAPALDRAADYAQRALKLDPRNYKACESLLFVEYLQGKLDRAFAHGERALELNPNDAETVTYLGLFYCFAGRWEKGLPLIARSQEMSPFHTPASYFPLILDCYRRGDDAGALAYSHRVNMPGFFWVHLIRAMVLGQLGRVSDASDETAVLLSLRPNIETEVHDELERMIKDETLRRRCLEGLRKAGLKPT